ncbi:MAG: ADP-ribosylation factor-like protein, partial [Candidatus Heimdallarchaeaceae archaeon]
LYMSYLFDEIYGKSEEAPAIEDKILLMGLQAAGKTAIKDVVFFNKSPEDMQDYMATVHYQRHYIDEEKSSMVIDSGGQESYWNEAVTHFRHLVFSSVKLLLWIVDVTHPEMFEESERRFSFTIRQYKKENPEGRITVLCHKVDLVPPERMVVIHQHIRESFDDPRFEVDFENTSIYYGESLKELIFTIMAESGIDTKRFELISNLGQKVEESEEFQSYLMEHQEDPRIAQLLDYLKPEAEITLPTFGELDLQLDLTEYGIIEIVLIDKDTYSPIVGASSKTDVTTQNSMDYLIALHDFKKYVKEKGQEIEPTGTIVSSDDEKVHGMIFNLAQNFLLITSFSEITEEKKKLFFELILKFAKSTADSTKETKPEPVAVPEPEPVAVPEPEPVAVPEPKPVAVPEPKPVAVPLVPQAPSVPITEDIITTETAPLPEIVDETIVVDEETMEVPQIEIMETPVVIEETTTVEPEIIIPPSPADVELITEEPKEEIEPVKTEQIEEEKSEEPTVLPEAHVESEPIIVEETPEILAESAPQVPVPSVPEPTTSPEVPANKVTEIPPEEQIVPEFVEKMVTESISEQPKPMEAVVEEKVEITPETIEPVATLNGIGDSSAINFSVDDIKNFASFLVQKKETVIEEISPDEVKDMSDFLTKGITKDQDDTIEEREEQSTE